jgi:glycosyltransferase involved in cell wall biosynthesis
LTGANASRIFLRSDSFVRRGERALSERRTAAVLIPTYNEEATLPRVLDAVRGVFAGTVIVVDDGSTDRTTEILRWRSDVLTIRHETNLGYGRSLADALSLACAEGFDYAVTVDADEQHEPAHIPQFLEAITRGPDVLSASRYHPKSVAVGVAPEERRAINRAITDRINARTGWRLTDAFCGFKAYRLSALEAIRLHEPGYAMPMEFWAKAYRAGLQVEELPIERIYHSHHRSFGPGLDDPAARLTYYLRVWDRALDEAA